MQVAVFVQTEACTQDAFSLSPKLGSSPWERKMQGNYFENTCASRGLLLYCDATYLTGFQNIHKIVKASKHKNMFAN